MPVKPLLLSLLWVTACASRAMYQPAPCQSDDECGAGQICFPEGCADPGVGIVVEVTGSNSSGFYEQDLAIPDGTLAPVLDLQVNGPLSLVGTLLREKSAGVDPASREAFTDPLEVLAIGSSDLIPGLARAYQANLSQTERGVFSMPIGAGTYRVTAQPAGAVPPLSIAKVSATSNKPASVEFVFPSVQGTVTLSGRLLKVTGDRPEFEVPLDVAMNLQAFDPLTQQAISQRVPVSAGSAAKGMFIVTMAPSAALLTSVLLVASPRDSNLAVPTKTFVVPTPLPTTVTLAMGDYGQALSLYGQVFDVTHAPIINALVVIDGIVKGGGRFHSKIVTTDMKGEFKLDALANAPGHLMVVAIAPPASSRATMTQLSFDVLQHLSEPVSFYCDDRLIVTGVLNRPDGTAARGVRVQATAQGADGPLPLTDTEAVTDSTGSYHFALDTGAWRLDFLPGDDLPRFSRLVTVKPNTDVHGTPLKTLTLGSLNLPKGRRVTGSVSNSSYTESQLMPSASIRFFRVTQAEGKSSSVLLGTAISDSRGRYSMTLPTR